MKKAITTFVLMALLLATAATSFAFDGIDGDVQDSKHERWIELNS